MDHVLEVDRRWLRKENRRLEREKQLPSDRICPGCRQIKVDSTLWVLTHKPMCRECYVIRYVNAPELVEVFREVRRFELDGVKLIQLRESFGLSRKMFSKLCGWSKAYQQQLESGNTISINEDTMDTMLQVLHEREQRK